VADLTLEIPEPLLDRIAVQAAENGRSLEDEVLHLLVAWCNRPNDALHVDAEGEGTEDLSG